MKLTRLASLAFPLLLTQCVDPYYGPNGADPYANPYRQDMRDQGSQMNVMAFERGQQDGQSDAQQGLNPDYNRYPSRFDRNTSMAYRDGYNQRYNQIRSSQGQLGVNPGYNNNQPGALPPPQGAQQQQPQQQRDPVYNQGYDYGLRDRTSGRVADPSAFVGRYDPRYRSSFERGYYDAFNSSSNGTAPAYPSNGGTGWFQ